MKDLVKQQLQRRVNMAAKQVRDLQLPNGGWIATVRDALGMSNAALARRLGVSAPTLHKTTDGETDGSVTLKNMERIAQAMGCRFVYAIVPETDIETLIKGQAIKKAKSLVGKASTHMALEDQQLLPEQLNEKIKSVADDLVRKQPRDFWEGE